VRGPASDTGPAGPSTSQQQPAQQQPAQQQPAQQLSPLARVRQQWAQVLEHVQAHSRVTHSLLSRNAQVVDVAGTSVTVGFATAGLRDSFARGNHVATLATALREVFHADLSVQAVVEGAAPGPATPGPATPAAPATPPRSSTPRQAQEAPRPQHHRDQGWSPPPPEPEDVVSDEDPDLDDDASAAELLAGVLGAEPIEEEAPA
jgi:DNA polymerase-3 subunit gamma/tau